ncbi:MAG: dihydrofolate reductase [Clostridia bacterium]|nr:dihydrofolate reductase [Clostridia bacterium]
MNAIAAVNALQYIGKQGDLLYSIQEDMAFFVAKTRGKTVVMGRKTLLSLPGGKGLKGRKNFVLSRSMSDGEAEERGVLIARDVDSLFSLLRDLGSPEEDVFVIGGGEIYSLLMPYCSVLYVTRILREDEGETRFPEIPSDFTLTKGDLRRSGEIEYRFDTYVKNR